MQRLLLGLCLVCIAALSTTRAQGVLAGGTYGLASEAQFSNASAFAASSSMLVTEGVLEIDALGVGVLTSLRVEDGLGNEALLTIQFDVGYSFSTNVINMAILECTENVIRGAGFGFSLCAAANTESGCARSIGWGQGTVNEPFENRTLIVFSNMCGLQGTQLWQCGAVGGCDPVATDLAEPALPIGNFVLDGIPPNFVYESPQSNPISLQNSTITVFNNYEYMLMFNFVSGPVTIIVRIYGAVVVDQASTLIFSFYNCSQAVSGGPAPVDVCTIMLAGGCETPVADSQVDLNPPQNETAIQLTNWCDFTSTIQYKCSGTCQGPINRLVAPTTLGFNIGNCLNYNGATLSFYGSPENCQIPLLAVDQIFINHMNVSNVVVQQQTVVQQTIQNQTVINQETIQQTVIQQTVTNQTVVNQEIVEQTVVQQTVVQQQVTNQTVVNQYVSNLTVANLTIESLPPLDDIYVNFIHGKQGQVGGPYLPEGGSAKGFYIGDFPAVRYVDDYFISEKPNLFTANDTLFFGSDNDLWQTRFGTSVVLDSKRKAIRKNTSGTKQSPVTVNFPSSPDYIAVFPVQTVRRGVGRVIMPVTIPSIPSGAYFFILIPLAPALNINQNTAIPKVGFLANNNVGPQPFPLAPLGNFILLSASVTQNYLGVSGNMIAIFLSDVPEMGIPSGTLQDFWWEIEDWESTDI